MVTKINAFTGTILFIAIFFSFSCTEDKINPEAKGHIKGQVIDNESDDGIQDVQLTTNPATKTYLTNDSGYFYITDIDIGEYTIAMRKGGYRSESVNVKVAEEDTTEITVIMTRNADFNKAPVVRNQPVPASGEDDQPLTVELKWSAYDQNGEDTLTYEIALYKSGEPDLKTVIKNLSDTIYTLENLEYNTTYFWQLSVSDGTTTVNSEIWSFKTTFFPDNPFVYARQVNDSYEIFSGDSTTLSTIQLTDNNKNDWYPKMDPFGSNIAFASMYGTDPHIYTMDIYGENVKKISPLPVTGHFNNGLGFCWSANGSRLYFAYNDGLYRIEKDGTGLTEIATAPDGRNFRIVNASHNGELLVALTVGANINDSEIYIMKVNGRDTVRIVDNLPGRIDYPSFSLDDKKILFTHDISENEALTGRQLNTHIFTVDIDTKELTDISIEKPDGTLDIQPAYAPDGSKIIFVNTSNTTSSVKNIWVMDTNGKNRHPVVSDAEMPQWK